MQESKILRVIEGWEHIPFGFKNIIITPQFLLYLKANNLKYDIDYANWTIRIRKH